MLNQRVTGKCKVVIEKRKVNKEDLKCQIRE